MDKSSFTIADCFSLIKNGANIKQDKGQRGYPITRIETTSNNIFNRDKVGYAGIEDITPYQDYVLEDGDLLMSHINSLPYLGRVVYYERKKNETIIHGMNLLRLKAIKTRLLPRYATFLFSSTRFKNKILAIAKKSVNQASFSINDLKKQCIELPTTEQQDHIVSKLIGIQKIIQLRNSQLAKLDELVKCRFVEMFGDPIQNKQIYKLHSFTEFAYIDAEMTTDYHKYANYPHIGIDSIEKETGRLIGYRTVAQDGVISGKYLFSPEHLIYSKIRPNLNKVACPDFHGVCSADSYPIRNKSNCNKYYLLYVLRSQWFLDYIVPLSSRTNLPKVNRKQIESFTWPLPPIELQNQFEAFVRCIDKLRIVIRQSLDEAQKLFDSLMQEYFD